MDKVKRIFKRYPVTCTFTGLCVVALLLNYLTAGYANRVLFSVYRSSLKDPLFYFRLVGHSLGHSGINHLLNNMLLVVLVGPMLEDRYPRGFLIGFILFTSVFIALANLIFFPNIRLLGASGVACGFLMLMATGLIGRRGEIPLSFMLVPGYFVFRQLYGAIFLRDTVSQFSHLLGYLCGFLFGYMNKSSRRRREL